MRLDQFKFAGALTEIFVSTLATGEMAEDWIIAMFILCLSSATGGKTDILDRLAFLGNYWEKLFRTRFAFILLQVSKYIRAIAAS